MRFKLDENLGRSMQALLEQSGHDAVTVREQGLRGSPDPEVLSAARGEGRVLVTMDHDFGNVLAYRPEETAGIAVINLSRAGVPALVANRGTDIDRGAEGKRDTGPVVDRRGGEGADP
ncbi:MAG: DUF5615 family PIN-like protein [Acidobacteriota bacterium]